MNGSWTIRPGRKRSSGDTLDDRIETRHRRIRFEMGKPALYPGILGQDIPFGVGLAFTLHAVVQTVIPDQGIAPPHDIWELFSIVRKIRFQIVRSFQRQFPHPLLHLHTIQSENQGIRKSPQSYPWKVSSSWRNEGRRPRGIARP